MNKVAVVTGASSGMGREIARLFAQNNIHVIAAARRFERLEELQKEYPEYIIPVSCDVKLPKEAEKVIGLAVEKFGKLDILVNNAGTMDDMTPIDDLTDELWDWVMETNTTSVMRFTREAVKVMRKQKIGSIINIASVGGIQGARAGAAYTASKHAVIGLTKNTAYMYALEGIRCNAICPGGVNTEIAYNGMTNINEFGMSRVGAGITNSPRSGEPQEVAEIALFLADNIKSSIVNGAVITADAGWTAY